MGRGYPEQSRVLKRAYLDPLSGGTLGKRQFFDALGGEAFGKRSFREFPKAFPKYIRPYFFGGYNYYNYI